MQKTIKLNSKESIALDNNAAWVLIYRNQFGHDIIPDLMPIISAGIELVGEMAKKDAFDDVRDFLQAIDVDEWENAFIRLSGMEFTTFINIAWAMAKAADDEIPDVMEWIKGFSVFPMDIIAPELIRLLIKGLVSTKNFNRLREAIPKP